MKAKEFEYIDTSKKAYKLVYNPTVLLSLLYSKYGDIEEDLNFFYINQLLYNKSSHYKVIFKEFQLTNNYDENLKRFYSKHETKARIPKLIEYYKNYHKFFCKPFFIDIFVCELMHNYEDEKAEIFYKKNFKDSQITSTEKEESDSDSFSSLDNITDNKLIFTKTAKKIIDQNLDSNCVTISLNANADKSINGGGLISNRTNNNSFEQIVYNLINYKKINKKKNINKKKENKEKDKNKNYKKINNNVLKFHKDIKNKLYMKSLDKNKFKINAYNIISKTINTNTISDTLENITVNVITPKQVISNKKSIFSLLKSIKSPNSNIKNNVLINNNYIKCNNNHKINQEINQKHINANSKTNTLIPTINNKKNYNLMFPSKFQNFKINCIKVNPTSLHHQRNKTYNFNGSINSSTSLFTFNNTINNNTNNDSKTLTKNSNEKIKKLTHFLTMKNANLNTKLKQINKLKKKTNTKLRDLNNETIKHLPLMKHNKGNSLKILSMCKNNYSTSIKNKSNKLNKLIKTSLMNKLKIDNNKQIKESSSNLYRNKKIISSNRNFIKHKQIIYESYNNNLNNNTNYNVFSSPRIVIRKAKKNLYKIKNKSEKPIMKNKPIISRHNKINNLSINFNNVIFETQPSNLNESNNESGFNTEISSLYNSNNVLSAKNKNPNNNINNKEITMNFSDLEKNNTNKNLYIMNFKNFYSRNRINYLGENSLTQENFLTSPKLEVTGKNSNSNDFKIFLSWENFKSKMPKKNKVVYRINSDLKKKNSIIIKGNNNIRKLRECAGFRENDLKKNISSCKNTNNLRLSMNAFERNNYLRLPINVNRNNRLISKKLVKAKQRKY